MTRSFGDAPSTLMEECSQGERHNGVSVSRLSQILMDSPPQKYYLSAKACNGILRRAEKRGKELPEQLRKALERQSAFKNEQENPGGGKGILIQNERVGALSTLNNQSVMLLDDQGGQFMSVCKDVVPTLRANKGGHEPIILEDSGNV